MLEAKDIAAKKLVYNETEARQVAQLADLRFGVFIKTSWK